MYCDKDAETILLRDKAEIFLLTNGDKRLQLNFSETFYI